MKIIKEKIPMAEINIDNEVLDEVNKCIWET